MPLTRFQRNFLAALIGLVLPIAVAFFIIGFIMALEYRTSDLGLFAIVSTLTGLAAFILAGWIAIIARPSIKLKHENNPGEYNFRTSTLAGSLGCIYCLMLLIVPVFLGLLSFKFLRAVPVILAAIPAAIVSHKLYFSVLYWMLKPRDWSPSDRAYLPTDEH